MFGRIELHQWVIVVISLVAMSTDLVRGKIYNWLTFPSILIGIGVTIGTSGVPFWPSLLQVMEGVFGGLLLFGGLFAMGLLGAGDVKLLMALGAWGAGGFFYTADVAVLSLLLGAAMALIILIVTGRFIGFLKRMASFFVSLSLTVGLSPWVQDLKFVPPKFDTSSKMPFGIPIALAGIWVTFWPPAGLWIKLWRVLF